MSAGVSNSRRGRRRVPRPLSRGERRIDAWVNGVSVVAAIVGVAALLAVAAPHANAARLASFVVYGAGLMAMLGASAAYNANHNPGREDWLRRLDHAAIFVMIAGT